MRALSSRFSKKWEEQREGLKGTLRPTKPLKSQINHATNRVEIQIQRINNYIGQYTHRDKELFKKITQAYEKHDNEHVNILANELAEIRKQKNILIHNKLALDNVALRLRTVSEFGNYVSVLTPVFGILQNIRTGISNIMPEVGNELGQVETALNDIVIGMGQSTGITFDFNPESEAAEKIIEEAALIVESRMKTRLPELPQDVFQGGNLIIKKDLDEEES